MDRGALKKRWIWWGSLLGAATLTPGISVASVAFAFGYYDFFLFSVRAYYPGFLLPKNDPFPYREERPKKRSFLLGLFLGYFLFLLFFSKAILLLLKDPFYRICLYALWLGVIASSFKELKKQVVFWRGKQILAGIFGAFLSFSMNFFSTYSLPLPSSFFWLLSVGILFSLAMLLPGISGSLVLSFLGLYPSVLEALGHIHQWESFRVLFFLGVGIVLGVISFVPLLAWGIQKYKDKVYAHFLGFLFGSLFFIWPYGSWVHYFYEEEAAYLTNQQFVLVLGCLLGGYFLLNKTHKKEKKILPIIE